MLIQTTHTHMVLFGKCQQQKNGLRTFQATKMVDRGDILEKAGGTIAKSNVHKLVDCWVVDCTIFHGVYEPNFQVGGLTVARSHGM